MDKKSKTEMQLIIDGVLAGAFIALGSLCSSITYSTTGSFVLSAAVFTVGFFLVVMTGAELFTGNCLILADDQYMPKDCIRILAYSYIGNLIGSLLIGYSYIYMTDLRCDKNIREIVYAKAANPTWEIFLRGVLCNVLVCLAVYCISIAKSTGQWLCACFIPILIFVLCQYEHSIADMFYFAAAKYDLQKSISHIGTVTAGNIIGGYLIGILLTRSYTKIGEIK